MYHSNVYTEIISNIFNQLKNIPSKALVAQWVHPFTITLLLVFKVYN